MNAAGKSSGLLHGGSVSLVLLLCLPFCSAAADWPQYRGSNHDGVSTDRIIKQWSGSVTNPVWRVSCTNGLSSLAVSGGRVFTQIRRTISGAAQEVAVALSATNGAELWATNLDDAIYSGGVGTDDGPRTTPAVDGGSVFILSSYLKLYRLNATNGAVIWQQNVRNLYGAGIIAWQNAASPLVEGGLIFLNSNSTNSTTLMALHTSDGGLAWRSQNEALTHATPVLATIHGVRQVIFATQGGLVSLDPASGTRLWKFAYPFTYSISLGASPVVYQDMVFISGAQAYGMGSAVARVDLTNDVWTTTQLWAMTGFPSTLATHWMTPVAYQGFLFGQFGTHGFDNANAQIRCIDMRTGTVKWSTGGFGRGGTILVDNHVVSITERGDLVLVQPNTNSYTELGRFQAIPGYHDFNNKCWNVPAVADGRIYVRSTAFAACFDFSVPDLKLDPPQLVSADKLQLTIRTVTGAALDSNRVAGLEVRATTNLAQTLAGWTLLTNSLVLTGGVVRIDNVDLGAKPRQFFIATEPN